MDHYYTHQLDAVALSWWGISFYWYWLFYLIGFLWVYLAGKRLLAQGYGSIDPRYFSKLCLISWVALFAGGRLFYVIAYNPDYFIKNPEMILKIWQGGMSFHGALLGVIIANLFYAYRLSLSLFSITDLFATVVPLALMLGRIGNFINGELVGKVSNVSWAVIFPRHGGDLPRHPSQLYGAIVEGLVLFVILYSQRRFLKVKAHQSTLFLFTYGLGRFIVGFFRAPDPQLGSIWLGLSLGQIFCLVMVAGAFLLEYRYNPFLVRLKKMKDRL